MTQALSSPNARDVRQCLDGLVEVVDRLTNVFHVQIQHTRMPAHELAQFDPETRTVRIRIDAPLADQVWALSDIWHMLAIGPWATSGARRQPTLWAVPQPRDATA